MKASIVIFAGVAATLGVALSGCEGYSWSRQHDHNIDVRNAQERAADCVAQFEPDGKAPQVMTYDSNTKTEVHMNTDGRNVDVTAQNKSDNTAMGMGGKVGGRIPEACTDADPVSGPASSKKRNYDTSWNNH